MNSRLPYNEVVDAFRRKLKEAQYKAQHAEVGATKKKYEGLSCLYESTIFFLTNNLTGRNNGKFID
jgi:hypothetical protein